MEDHADVSQEALDASPFRRGIALWLAAMVGFACVLPYAFKLGGGLLEAANTAGLSEEAIVAFAAAQNGALFAVVIALGLLASGRVGLGTPMLDALLTRQPAGAMLRACWRPAMACGVGLGLVILGLIAVSEPDMPEGFLELGATVTWVDGLLASFYGGIAEEILCRLFLLSMLAWGLRALFARGASDLPDALFWSANVLAAVLFGLGHLPSVIGLVEITATVIVYVVLLNGILGVSFGWLFRRYGLLAAMLAHFATDIVLHVIPPLVTGGAV
jgi:membrane protease YdiL (CAAX protease family)